MEKDVIEIRSLYNNEIYNQYELAAIYKVCVPTISEIVNRKSWKHLA